MWKKEKEKTFPVIFYFRKMLKKIGNLFLFLWKKKKKTTRILLAVKLSDSNFPLRIPAIFHENSRKMFLKFLENFPENSRKCSWKFLKIILDIHRIFLGNSRDFYWKFSEFLMEIIWFFPWNVSRILWNFTSLTLSSQFSLKHVTYQ